MEAADARRTLSALPPANNPIHIHTLSYGMPFLAGYFLGRYVEVKKAKKP